MQVYDVQHHGFQLIASVVLGLKEPHPHVRCVIVDDEQAVAEVMWGGDIH
jgi:pyrimidine deaminase RibD-like protein